MVAIAATVPTTGPKSGPRTLCKVARLPSSNASAVVAATGGSCAQEVVDSLAEQQTFEICRMIGAKGVVFRAADSREVAVGAMRLQRRQGIPPERARTHCVRTFVTTPAPTQRRRANGASGMPPSLPAAHRGRDILYRSATSI